MSPPRSFPTYADERGVVRDTGRGKGGAKERAVEDGRGRERDGVKGDKRGEEGERLGPG
ncbi:hypothetical protein ALC62_01407 [Cyphomyrmex costatus]|uniref:Uncharacterized protein n=1 Tax=Cyphomyrmex costatus TaxID=456900 RepID=A0A195D3X2_9HYME|nr:hypothetical protein ALC62_01407 [Cyphomyrmex costatus]